MSILYLTKKNDEFISFCSCTESLVGDPGQLDCPWCGCGWLFSCTKCRKAFSFAVATEINKTWEEIAAEDLYSYSKRQATHEEISEWIENMQAMQSEIELGKTYVYLDGVFIATDEENISIEGWYAKHEFEHVPQLAAVTNSEIRKLVLSNPDYWRKNQLSDK
jgi:arsenate reductase-like glutaredoxin family protein